MMRDTCSLVAPFPQPGLSRLPTPTNTLKQPRDSTYPCNLNTLFLIRITISSNTHKNKEQQFD
jgi:hypothetical protein